MFWCVNTPHRCDDLASLSTSGVQPHRTKQDSACLPACDIWKKHRQNFMQQQQKGGDQLLLNCDKLIHSFGGMELILKLTCIFWNIRIAFGRRLLCVRNDLFEKVSQKISITPALIEKEHFWSLTCNRELWSINSCCLFKFASIDLDRKNPMMKLLSGKGYISHYTAVKAFSI